MDMGIFHAYIYGTSLWLSVQAAPLLVVPSLILTLLSSQPAPPTDLEVYLSRALSLSLLTLAVITLSFTGIIPLSSNVTEPISLSDSDPKAPYARPIIYVTTLYHGVSGVYCYVRYMGTSYGAGAGYGRGAGGQMGYVLGMVGAGTMAAMGVWCLMFADGEGRRSRRTGADKRVSGWPFGNVEADKRRGKEKRAE